MVIKGGNADDHKALAVDNSSALCLLVRIVDDFLLISTDYDTSKRFLNVLNKGGTAIEPYFYVSYLN